MEEREAVPAMDTDDRFREKETDEGDDHQAIEGPRPLAQAAIVYARDEEKEHRAHCKPLQLV